MKVNFAGQDIPDFSPIPAGTYHFIVTNGKVEDTDGGPNEKNPTGQYITWELTGQEGEARGKKAWTRTPLGGDGRKFLKAMLWAAGQLDKDYDGDLDFEIEDVEGAHVQATVTINKEYQNNNVRNVRPYEGASTDSALTPA